MREVVAGQIYVHEHPVRFAGGRLLTRMTLIVLADGGVLVHSPVPFDDALRKETTGLGEVRAIAIERQPPQLWRGARLVPPRRAARSSGSWRGTSTAW